MTKVENLKKLLAQLQLPDANQVELLQKLSSEWVSKFENEVVSLLKGNNLFPVIAKAMDENFNEWHKDLPPWVVNLISTIYLYREGHNFSLEHVTAIVSVFRKYILGGCWSLMRSFFHLAGFEHVPKILVDDTELFDAIKKDVSKPYVLKYFGNCASLDFNPWKRKMMEDKEFILSVLGLDSVEAWNLLVRLAGHPDAKVLMPNEVVVKAGKSKQWAPVNLYALLCSDKDLKAYELDSSYLDTHTKVLNTLLTTGVAVEDNVRRSLNSLLPPISNLSAIDSCKEMIGEKTVKLLMKVIVDNLPDSSLIRGGIKQSRREAAKALWNLAYLKSNCIRIVEDDGIERLKKAKVELNDQMLSHSIDGILHMCNMELNISPPEHKKKEEIVAVGGDNSKHIMISYNWDNQQIVTQLAQSLKDKGYNVWLDLEQMGGSTLEAMALAIEKADLVLLCMSQKYKDSPNCRLEGEYCVNKRVEFVPLMMQKGYSPDGWLGIALGSKLWYDFTHDSNWDSRISGLIKAIGERGKASKLRSSVGALPPPSPIKAKETKKVDDWNNEDMLNWLKSERLEQHFEKLCQHDVNGQALMELKHFLNDPQHFGRFESMFERMGIAQIGTVLRFASAIRKL